MVSVVCGALASAQVFRASLLLLHEHEDAGSKNAASLRWAAVLGAVGGFALSPLVWSYSTHAEVFALNNLLVATLVLLALQYSAIRRCHADTRSSPVQGGCSGNNRAATNRPDDGGGVARRAAFCIGLGISNQHTSVLTALPAVCMAVITSSGTLLAPRALAQLAAAGALGLTPYAYLVWAARDAPVGSWGDTHTLEGFFRHILRREYGTLTLLPGQGSAAASPGLAAVSWLYVQHLQQQSPAAWSLVAALAGIVACLTAAAASPSASDGARAGGAKARSSGAWRLTGGVQVIIMLVLYLAVFNSLANIPLEKDMYKGVLKRFWMQSHVMAAILIAPGARLLLRAVALWHQPAAVGAVAAAAVALQCAGVLASCACSWNASHLATPYTLHPTPYALRPTPKA
jgi:hypothetical protein